jgi:hypothetical protein
MKRALADIELIARNDASVIMLFRTLGASRGIDEKRNSLVPSAFMSSVQFAL